MTRAQLLPLIQRLRSELYILTTRHGLSHPAVVAKSQQIDALIVAWHRAETGETAVDDEIHDFIFNELCTG